MTKERVMVQVVSIDNHRHARNVVIFCDTPRLYVVNIQYRNGELVIELTKEPKKDESISNS